MANERMKNILNWYVDHTEANPNMYELVEVLSEASREENKNDELISILSNLELSRLLRTGIAKDQNDSLIQMVLELKNQIDGGQEVSYEKEDFLKKLAGVSFYLKTEEMEKGVRPVYANAEEYIKLLDFKDAFIDSGETVTDAIRGTMDFVASYYKNDDYRLPDRHTSISLWANKRTHGGETKIMAMVSLIEPYIYPPNAQKLVDYIMKDHYLPADLALESIRDVSMGKDFGEIYQRIMKENVNGTQLLDIINVIVLYAKNGIDFYHFAANQVGYKPTPEDLAYLDMRKRVNEELEKQYPSDTLGAYEM